MDSVPTVALGAAVLIDITSNSPAHTRVSIAKFHMFFYDQYFYFCFLFSHSFFLLLNGING